MAIIKNPLTIVQTGGESQVPEYMSAKNFTFDGNACTGYVGDNSFPEIIIPKSYSKIDTVTTGYTFVNISRITATSNSSLTSITLCNKDGSNEHTYLDSDQLIQNFDIDFAGQSEVRINSFSYSTNVFTNTKFRNYMRDLLLPPIFYNNEIYNDTHIFVDTVISAGNNTISPLSGQTVESTFFDGDDYQVTAVASNNDSSSGFRNYYNKVILLNNITSIGANAFNACINLSEISMPSTITDIGDYAFFNCRNLKMIAIPPNVNSIGSSSFSYCSNLTSAIVPEGVASIGINTFLGAGLMTIILPSTVTSINVGAFDSCRALQSIEIPASVTSISDYTFNNCSSLTTMTILAVTPPTLGNTNAISSATTKIYIPAGTLSAYQSATNWSNFASLFEELPA